MAASDSGSFLFEDFKFDLVKPPTSPQLNGTKTSRIKRSRLAERIADTDELVRQLKQLQERNQQLTDLQRTASEVAELYKQEKQLRQEKENEFQKLTERCAQAEHDLDVQKQNCEDLEVQLETRGLPFETKEVVTVFMALAQRIHDEHGSNGLQRREQFIVRKIRDYCKTAKISLPPPKSPANRRKASAAAAQANAQTQTDAPSTRSQETQSLQSVAALKPTTSSVGVQSENMVATRDQGTQHKYTTTTRGTTTASFIKYQDVGTCFPEPQPPPTIEQMLNEMNDLFALPSDFIALSPIGELVVEETKVVTKNVGTCTQLCNVLREIDFLPTVLPQAQIKVSNSRPPSRASVKDELIPPSTPYEYSNLARELFNFLPHNQNSLNNVPPNAFEELWQIFGQMVLGLLQRRAHPALSTPKNISQADFSNWLYELYEGKQNSEIDEASNFTKADYENDATNGGLDVGTDPLEPHQAPLGNLPSVELTPIRIPAKPKANKKRKSKSVSEKSLKRSLQETEMPSETSSTTAESLRLAESISPVSPEDPIAPECAVNFLSMLQHLDNCDNLELDEEERYLLELASTPSKTSTFIKPLPESATEINREELKEPKEQNNESKSQTEAETKIVAETEAQTESVRDANNAKSPLLLKSAVRDLQSCFEEVYPQPNCQNFGLDQLKASLFGTDSDSSEPECEEKMHEMIESDFENLADSPVSDKLVIDESDADSASTASQSPVKESKKPTKRKRRSDSIEVPVVKRITRLRAKQMLLENTNPPDTESIKEEPKGLGFFRETDRSDQDKADSNIDCDKAFQESKSNQSMKKSLPVNFDESPASPSTAYHDNDTEEPIEIPLESVADTEHASKALLKHLIEAQKCEKQTTFQDREQQQIEQLCIKVLRYLKESLDLESSCWDLAASLYKVTRDDDIINTAMITAYAKVEPDEGQAQDRLVNALKFFEMQQTKFIHRFMNTLEQSLFRTQDRFSTEVTHEMLKLYLRLIALQTSLYCESYANPARLLIAKILYHINFDVPTLILEVLNQYPTVLPHREERSYDHSDALITVIKHLLMSQKYDMQDAQGAERKLLSKLRFEYHFNPFEPTKTEVLENLIEKLKAGKVQDLCYAFALFCRRCSTLDVVKEVLTERLMPLASTYCDLCLLSEDYDERMETLLVCISMTVKRLPLETDISAYMALFKRLSLAGPRANIQQAAVQAILRLRRFGYSYVLEPLNHYEPSYDLSPMTRAMLRTFVERRQIYKSGGTRT